MDPESVLSEQLEERLQFRACDLPSEGLRGGEGGEWTYPSLLSMGQAGAVKPFGSTKGIIRLLESSSRSSPSPP